MKVHAGVDSGSGYVHSITGTAANVHDIDETLNLIREDDHVVYGDSGYFGIQKHSDEVHLSRDAMGQRLVYGDRHVVCGNTTYLLRDNSTENVLRTFPIKQNEDGIDTEDRIVLLKNLIASNEFYAEIIDADEVHIVKYGSSE